MLKCNLENAQARNNRSMKEQFC